MHVFNDLGHVALADMVHGTADTAFAISRERVEAIDPSWPAAEVDGGVRVFIDPKALREVVPPPPPGNRNEHRSMPQATGNTRTRRSAEMGERK